MQDYDVSYLTGTTNKSVIKTRFSAPGGIETMTPGYTDFRSDEFSVYNSTTYKNLSVIRPYQGPSGTLAKADGAINSATGIRVQDIHNEDYGLRSHLARHTARFGRDSVHVPTPPGATYDELPGFHKVHRNTLRRMKAVYSPTSEVTGFTTGSEFDNYFVQHQIPRSTKQYSWIAATVEGDNRISGFVPRNFHYSTSAGTVDAYTFATGSSFGSYMVSGVRKFGADKKEKPNNSNIVGFLPTVSRLNLNVLDPLTASTNMLGNPLSSEISSYRGPQVAQFSAAPAQASLFNALMIKRSGFFGYPTWRRIRAAQESPIMNHHHKNNKIPIYDPESGTNILYTVPPLSMRDRAHRISLRQNDGTSMLLRAEHRNEYFNTVALDNKLGMRTGPTPLTPLTSVILAAYNSKDIANINYLVYTENIFPSARNEFMSHSTQRLNYSSNFWHSTRAERNSLNAEFIPSGTVNDYATFPIHKGRKNSFGLYTSQSAWPLDAPTNFLERTGAYGTPSDFQPTPFTPLKTLNANVPIYVPWIVSGNAGELQNTYNSYFSMGRGYPLSGAYPHDMFSGRRTRLANALAGPLYSRKQMLASPLSVTKPTGIYVARAGRVLASSTGSQVAGGFQRMPWGVSGSWPYSISQYSASIYTGEALWEAGVKAGITKKTGSTYQFVAAPSIPFYDSYDQYRGDLKFLARGYSIVPEYRISRNLEEYVENDSPFVSGKTDHFEIPGTTINSSQSGFYIDYSNSEFLKHFAEIRDSSGLNPAEVRLVVSASLKFMPYEGFYPAQRTMDLVKRFSDSYGETFDSSVTGQDGTTKQTFTGKDLFKTVPGAARSVIQPLFAPGILYNTIKSGIAVDYPVLFSDNKMIRSLNYSDGGIINPYTTKDALAPL